MGIQECGGAVLSYGSSSGDDEGADDTGRLLLLLLSHFSHLGLFPALCVCFSRPTSPPPRASGSSVTPRMGDATKGSGNMEGLLL